MLDFYIRDGSIAYIIYITNAETMTNLTKKPQLRVRCCFEEGRSKKIFYMRVNSAGKERNEKIHFTKGGTDDD